MKICKNTTFTSLLIYKLLSDGIGHVVRLMMGAHYRKEQVILIKCLFRGQTLILCFKIGNNTFMKNSLAIESKSFMTLLTLVRCLSRVNC